jgi:dUTPase
VEDSDGNLLTSDDSDVSLAIGSGPSGATPGGTTTVQAENGVATFDDLSFDVAGNYTLTASDGNLLTTSNEFSVFSNQSGAGVTVERVWTTDSKNLMVQYNVATNPNDVQFPINVYRSADVFFVPQQTVQAPIAAETITGANASAGVHTIEIGPGDPTGQYKFSQSLPLRPDPTHPFVIATADETGVLSTDDQKILPQGEFRIWVVGVVTHGLAFSYPNQAGFSDAEYKVWVDQDAQNLVTDDGFDEAIGFHWENPSVAATPNQTIIAGSVMESFLKGAIAGLGPQVQNSYYGEYSDKVFGSVSPGPNDVIDVDFIGHSRGAVVISEAIQDLSTDASASPQLQAGFISQTLVDPHPANNIFRNFSFAVPSVDDPAKLSLTIAAIDKTEDFQNDAMDPNTFVPANVQAVVDLYQNEKSSTFTYLINSEALLNLWGESPTQIDNYSQASFYPLPQVIMPGIGHAEIQSEILDPLIARGGALGLLGLGPFVNSVTTTTSSASLASATDSLSSTAAAGAATSLVVTSQPPATVTGNSWFGLAVSAEDSSGTLDTNYNGPVTLSFASNLLGAAMAGTATVDAVNGVANFAGLSIYQPGSYSLSATAAGLTSGTSSDFTVTTPAATELVVQAPSSNVLTGGAFTLTVDAEDAFGSVDANFAGAVSLSLDGAAGDSLGGTLTATAVDGVATFSGLTISAAGGGDVLTASSAGLTSGSSQPFSVTNDQLVVTTSPDSPIAGQGFGLIVEAENAAGAVDHGFTGLVTLAPSPAPDGSEPVLGGTFARMAVGGVATFFGLTLSQSGGYTVTASADGAGSGDSAAFTVSGGGAVQLAVLSIPITSTTVGAPFNVNIAAEDALGNPDSSFNGPVTISIAGGSGTLGGILTADAVNGVASFSSLTVSAAGTYTLAANGDGFSATSSSIVITPAGVTTSLEFSTQPPTSAAANAAFTVAVTAVDSLGNVDSSFTGPVTISEAGGATIQGTLTVNAVNGVATFTGLSIDAAGYGYSLLATASGLAPANGSDSLNIMPGAATQLVVENPTGNVLSGSPFNATVFAEDVYGNVASDFNGAVAFALPSTSGQTLSGTTTVNAVNGIAAFDDLTLSGAIASNTLTITSGLLTASTTFAATSDELVVTIVPPGQVALNEPFGFTVSALNGAGAVDTGYSGSITVSLLDYQSTGAVLSGTLTATAVNGVANFSGLSVNLTGAYGLTILGTSAGATTSALTVQSASSPSSTILPTFGHVKLPVSAIAGQKVAVSLPLSLKATGSTLKGKYVVYIYADASTTLSGQQVLVGTFSISATIKSGKIRAWSLRLTSLPSSLPADTYHILAEVVDPTGAASLVATSQTLQVLAPAITLMASVGVVSPKDLVLGKAGSVAITVENTGNVTASGPLAIVLSASTDGTLAGIVSTLVSETIKVNLVPRRRLAFRLRFKAPNGLLSFFPFADITLSAISATATGGITPIF